MNNASLTGSLRGWICATAVVVLLAGCRIERTPQADPTDPVNIARDEIGITLREYRDALVAGDIRRAAAVFTPAAHLYLPDLPAIQGRGEIDVALTQRFADDSIVGMEVESEEVSVNAGVAHQFGTFHQTLRDTAGAERVVDGRFAIRWVRAGDSVWRIERLLINHAPDAETDPAAAADTAAAPPR